MKPNFTSMNLARISQEIYFSTDIETRGPAPGRNSMMSIGSVAFTLEQGIIGQFSINIQNIPGTVWDDDNRLFWQQHNDAYWEAMKDQIDPKQAMIEFRRFVLDIAGETSPVFASDVAFDYAFIYWYFNHFQVQMPFNWSGFEFKSWASGVLKIPYRDTRKSNMPKHWFPENPIRPEHVALNDAINNAHLFITAMTEHHELPNPLLVTRHE